jgi:hypothetical protein
MIKLHELNPATRCWLSVLTPEEQTEILDLATDVMFSMEQRSLQRHRTRSGLGENGSVELVIKTILFLAERGIAHV